MGFDEIAAEDTWLEITLDPITTDDQQSDSKCGECQAYQQKMRPSKCCACGRIFMAVLIYLEGKEYIENPASC